MDEITQLKADIFDLQVEMANVKQKIDLKIKLLNTLLKKEKEPKDNVG